ncbi:MAG: 3-hydroxyacyl-CoA dehydrogenase [Sphingobacteriales bacterium 17-39-43]|uniref:3-hydroxyacyl-CoA dehydrogenase family protein n=1 Tax=Daejeonella sp. TaxID=2805397 RepID=UPI000BCD05C0|nr:3-hydroxyacyl-CoA dehydrogenase NAD-binding domain-containing protein [Daejeonella sp.]OYZ31771.1 MAG: 3-hydroxyacyl-CoA dehydrogenase [Sphingobacteriales bacterium 16-39-50]OZA24904.1 MAG: 3-hydroxyacyl-CoA dehydrogenase [Sphingobacteriales bacterium 17-39-43]OZA58167.1 MAG: 3-hydroxyacyl-CoA dehydrogenase [Sphingobacteriales bacterium 39-40-5]HQS04085.1 3-hydroxyacyl-CoA dehydrogenase NAD-binding domain-containing protein [Daejeonella sp.]HQS51952.1 3-hydroxyacyl-CoA dehydrogenase NAD-bin
MNNLKTNPANIEVGVVGIGLMGSSIIVSLLASGHQVKAIAPIQSDFDGAAERIADHLKICSRAKLLRDSVSACLDRLYISMDYGCLSDCRLVLECVIEDVDIKSKVYRQITDAVSASTVIASNTSAIAITLLQKLVSNPERFIGIHWAEPAYATRFMEITCGDITDPKYASWVFKLAHKWAKEPTLLRKDIRGFIANRLMYAVYREIFHLIENGKTTMVDADKAFRYDVGSWITLMGLFRRIDYTGLADHAEIFKNLFPHLSNAENVPDIMQKIVADNCRGIQNLNGLYHYSTEEAKEWEEAFAAFNEDIFRLAALHPAPVSEKESELA